MGDHARGACLGGQPCASPCWRRWRVGWREVPFFSRPVPMPGALVPPWRVSMGPIWRERLWRLGERHRAFAVCGSLGRGHHSGLGVLAGCTGGSGLRPRWETCSMRRRKPIYYLVKTCRASGYGLFCLMLVFILTGFALCGQYGVEQWIGTEPRSISPAAGRALDCVLSGARLGCVLPRNASVGLGETMSASRVSRRGLLQGGRLRSPRPPESDWALRHCRRATRAAEPTTVFPGDAPSGGALGTMEATRLGEGSSALPDPGQKPPVPSLSQRVSPRTRGSQPLPQQGAQGRQTLHAGVFEPVLDACRPDREEAGFSISCPVREPFPWPPRAAIFVA